MSRKKNGKRKLKKSVKTLAELAKEVRKVWKMNPVTRIKVDNQLDTTKRRQAQKKAIQQSQE